MGLRQRVTAAYDAFAGKTKGNSGLIVTNENDRALELINTTLKLFTASMNQANDIIYPDRVKFIQYLKLAFNDAQVSNCINIRRSFIDSDIEIIDSKGNSINGLKDVFEDYDGETAAWFNDYITNVHDSILTGHTLQQLNPLGSDGKPTGVTRINDEYLLTPWEMCRESIDLGFSKSFNVIDYNAPEYSTYVTSVINRESTGILPKIMNYVIYKQIYTNWRAFLENSGRDIVVIKTQLSDSLRKSNAEASLRSLDKGSRVVAHTDDVIEMLQSSNSSAGQDGYLLLIKQCDRCIASLLNGSDLTAEKSFVGAMEVQERIYKSLQKNDMRIISRVVNSNKSFKKLGILPEGAFMRWRIDDVISVENIIKMLQIVVANYDVDPSELEKYVKMKIGGRIKDEPVTVKTQEE